MTPLFCVNCGSSYTSTAKFCSTCGQQISKRGDSDEDSSYITKSVIFYVAFVVYIAIYYFTMPDFPTLTSELVLEGVFAAIILGFVFVDFKNVARLFKFKKVPVKAYLIAFGAPLITAPLVYISTGALNLYFFDLDYNTYTDYVYFPNSIFWAFVFISFVPAVFEELGFRGYLFNQMLNITSPKITIAVTAFLFALMHMSLLGLIWLIPFGVLLGYLRYRYKVIWLGMATHFVHNSIVLLVDIYYYNY